MSPVMNGPERLELIRTLEEWTANAQAGIACEPPSAAAGIIALIKRPSDKPDPPGAPE